MNLDQEKADFSYDDPTNATWADPNAEHAYSVTFHPEVLGPRPAFEADHGSPFVTTPFMFSDYGKYREHEDIRGKIRRELWPHVERATIQFEREQWQLFETELDRIVAPVEREDEYTARVLRLFNGVTLALQWFTLDFRDEIWAPAKETFENVKGGEKAEQLTEFAETYRDSGRLVSIWRQLSAVNSEIVSTYPTWMPILQLRYWRELPPNVNAYVVSDKKFDELKHLYLAAFETTARMSVIALAADLLASGEDLIIPTPKRQLTIWDFEQLDNARKQPLLSARKRLQVVAPFLRTKLRNGIGHNSAHYDPRTDEVVCVSARASALREWRLGYTEFCYELLRQTSVLVYMQSYFFNLLLVAGHLRQRGEA